MSEGDLEASGPADHEAPGKPPRRRGLRIALGCLAVMTTACLVVCGLAGYGLNRHAKDVESHEAAPMPDAANETEPGFRMLAEARTAVGAGPVDDCGPLETAIEAELASLDADQTFAFYAWVRDRLAELDTQPLREACQTVGYGGCSDEAFLAFRAYLLVMGRPTYELAVADDDRALARILPKNAYCRAFAEILYGAAVHPTLAADAGLDAAVDGAVDAVTDGGLAAGAVEAAADAGPEGAAGGPTITRIDPTTATVLRARRDLPRNHPQLCRRFSCTFDDVFD